MTFHGHKVIWKTWAPLEIKIFLWLAFRRRHWTGDRRLRHRLEAVRSAIYTIREGRPLITFLPSVQSPGRYGSTFYRPSDNTVHPQLLPRNAGGDGSDRFSLSKSAKELTHFLCSSLGKSGRSVTHDALESSFSRSSTSFRSFERKPTDGLKLEQTGFELWLNHEFGVLLPRSFFSYYVISLAFLGARFQQSCISILLLLNTKICTLVHIRKKKSSNEQDGRRRHHIYTYLTWDP
jgi:hypothetical protein